MTSSDDKAGERGTSGLSRILALSDGVFAIAMTLLVLTLAVPQLPSSRVDAELPKALLRTWPHTLSYIISFLVIGVYWRAHRDLYGQSIHPSSLA